MKWILIALTLSGCATQPLSFEQRMQLVHAMNANRYVLPPPPVLTVPQQRQPIVCSAGYNNTVVCQ